MIYYPSHSLIYVGLSPCKLSKHFNRGIVVLPWRPFIAVFHDYAANYERKILAGWLIHTLVQRESWILGNPNIHQRKERRRNNRTCCDLGEDWQAHFSFFTLLHSVYVVLSTLLLCTLYVTHVVVPLSSHMAQLSISWLINLTVDHNTIPRHLCIQQTVALRRPIKLERARERQSILLY